MDHDRALARVSSIKLFFVIPENSHTLHFSQFACKSSWAPKLFLVIHWGVKFNSKEYDMSSSWKCIFKHYWFATKGKLGICKHFLTLVILSFSTIPDRTRWRARIVTEYNFWLTLETISRNELKIILVGTVERKKLNSLPIEQCENLKNTVVNKPWKVILKNRAFFACLIVFFCTKERNK